MQSTSIYFHIPFCNRRCGYCDFNTFAGMKAHLPLYVEALCQEQKIVSRQAGKPIQADTIFFGGGTPSLLDAEQVGKILKTAQECFDLEAGAEVTLEANPGTVDRDYLQAIHELGVNRISFGMQSAHPDDLRILNRQHRHEDVIRAVAWARQAGIGRINLDLIFGIPGQDLLRWQETLKLALMEGVDHFSLYSLIVEDGTPLKQWIDRGLLDPPDDDLAADMYGIAMDTLEAAGFEQYEISNWAKKGLEDQRCRHNLQYWRLLPYLGFGAGAHGFFEGTRMENVNTIPEYIHAIQVFQENPFPGAPACTHAEKLPIWDQMQEFLMVGFRLTSEGVSKGEFQRRFGQHLEACFNRQIQLLFKQGLIEVHPNDADRLRLTRKGRFFGNQVFAQFVGNRQPAWLKD